MMRHFFAFAMLPVLALSLGGCGETKRALGFSKRSPDEFRVVTNPPLSMPPEYKLDVPQPGAIGVEQKSLSEKAVKALGTTASTRQDLSPAEAALLSKAGSEAAPDDIRSQLLREQGHDVKDESLWEKIKEGTLIVDKRDNEAKADTIDPKTEAASMPSTSPDIEKRPEGFLDPEQDPTKVKEKEEEGSGISFGTFK